MGDAMVVAAGVMVMVAAVVSSVVGVVTPQRDQEPSADA